VKYLIAVLAGFLMAVAVTSFGQGSPAPAKDGRLASPSVASSPASTLQQRNPRYRLGKSDSFDIDFTFSPELNQTVAVQPDGYVTLKEVGSIYVEGQTVPELTETLKASYSKTLHNPVITVTLRDFEKPYFIASGQVGKPGRYDLRGPLTVTEGVAIAGGFTESSKHSQVVLFHAIQNGIFEAKLLNVKELLASRNLSEDVFLQPGDMLYVPQNTISKIRKFIPSSSLGAFYNPAIN
jgi:polysaccharide export outer membrane protein